MSNTELERLTTICAGYGLAIGGARVSGDILELRPASLSSLPGAAVLREVAAELRELGHRYVTLVIDSDVAPEGT